MRVYIAGPMTGLPDHNRPAFQTAEEILFRAGHEVYSPAHIPIVAHWEWADYMRPAIAMLLNCRGVALLDGWQKSRGARIERRLAADLCMDVRPLDAWREP